MNASSKKKELAVAALRCGTVIDRIPSQVLFKVVRMLGLESTDRPLTIGNNLESRHLGAKGIIKIADTFFPEDVLNRIALIAPNAKINIIRDYEVVEKRRVELPEELVGLVKCSNPKCITNNEPMATRFAVVDREDLTIRCHYCGRDVKGSEASIV